MARAVAAGWRYGCEWWCEGVGQQGAAWRVMVSGWGVTDREVECAGGGACFARAAEEGGLGLL